MTDIKKVADGADMIVNGYAFTRCQAGYRAVSYTHLDVYKRQHL